MRAVEHLSLVHAPVIRAYRFILPIPNSFEAETDVLSVV